MNASVETRAPAALQAHVGRQAIVDASLDVFAYELLFRTADGAGPGDTCGERATSEVLLTTFLDIGLDRIVDDRVAFINMPASFLLDPRPLPFPPERVVLEVLEDTPVDADFICALARLADRGYRIALDDYVPSPAWVPLLPLAEFVKLDVRTTDDETLARQIDLLAPRGIRMLAEKVETREEFDKFSALGFDLFQGYFLSRPSMVSSRRVALDGLSTVRLLAELQNPGVEFESIEGLVARDLPLSYKLLRYLNSPIFGLRTEVTSMHRAVVLMGLEKLRRWTSLALLARGDDRPSELLGIALVRARMCELLAISAGRTDAETDTHFTAGMLSALDVLMDMPLADVLAELPLTDELHGALIGHTGVAGEALACALAYERCDFAAAHYGDLGTQTIRETFADATAWAFATQRELTTD